MRLTLLHCARCLAAAIAVSVERDLIATGANDATCKLWRLSTGELMHTIALARMGRVRGVEILLENDKGSTPPPPSPLTPLRVCSAADSSALASFKGVTIAAAIDDVVRVFDVHTLFNPTIPTVDCDGDVALYRLMHFLSEYGAWGFHRLVGYSALVLSRDREISARESMEQKTLFSTREKVSKYVLEQRGHVTVRRGGSDNAVVGVVPSPLRATLRATSKQYMRCLCSSGRGGTWLAAGLSSGAVAIWSRESQAAPVAYVGVGEEGMSCAGGNGDNRAEEDTEGTQYDAIELHGHTDDVSCVTANPSGRLLASASDDGKTHVRRKKCKSVLLVSAMVRF